MLQVVKVVKWGLEEPTYAHVWGPNYPLREARGGPGNGCPKHAWRRGYAFLGMKTSDYRAYFSYTYALSSCLFWVATFPPGQAGALGHARLCALNPRQIKA